jgi:hypothetical protein
MAAGVTLFLQHGATRRVLAEAPGTDFAWPQQVGVLGAGPRLLEQQQRLAAVEQQLPLEQQEVAPRERLRQNGLM